MNENGKVRPSILAIDDEIDFSAVFEDYFSLRGYGITTVSDGARGLELLETGDFDVVILDLKIGKVSGEDIIDRIFSNGFNVGVIVVSAYLDGGRTKTRLLDKGIFGFMEKPLSSLRDLEKMVSDVYNKKKGNRC